MLPLSKRPHFVSNLFYRTANVHTARKHELDASIKLDPTNWSVESLPNGIRLAHPPPYKGPNYSPLDGPPTIRVICQAGSRYENHTLNEAGISHLIRRSLGLSSKSNYGLKLTRSLQQLGAEVRCTTGRELVNFSLSVSQERDLLTAVPTFNEMVFDPAFYIWELYDTPFRLMVDDLKFLHARDLSILNAELLHKAAFRNQGLGNSLYAPSYKLQHYRRNEPMSENQYAEQPPDDFVVHFSEEMCTRFARQHLTPARSLVVCTGLSGDGLEEVRRIFTEDRLLNAKDVFASSSSTAAPNKFHYGGVQRVENPNANLSLVSVAWPVLKTDPKKAANLRVLLAALVGSHLQHSAHCACPTNSILANSLASKKISAVVGSLDWSYSDVGLVGVQFAASNGSSVAAGIGLLKQAMLDLMQKELGESQLKIAKSACKTDLLMGLETSEDIAELVAQQLFSPSRKLTGLDEIATAIDGVTAASLKSTAVEIFTNKAMPAFSAVGDIQSIPYLDELYN